MAAKSGNSGLKVWLNGSIVVYDRAKVPILTHSMQYGSGIFEGIRAYQAEKGTAIFRLKEHVKRFMESAKIYSMDIGYDAHEIENAVIETVRINKLKSCYIRPFAFYSDDRIGLDVSGKKISVFIAAVPFSDYFGNDGKGLKAKVSSWRRINSDILPVAAKASGNYINSIISSIEAKASGFDEAILLSGSGHVSEGSAENIFLVKNGAIVTPHKASDILLGITRDTVIKLGEASGIVVDERSIHREELYTADEIFFSGTAAGIAPIVNVDGISIGSGRVGSITKMIAEKYAEARSGNNPDFEEWVTYV